jgi:hypothetical protein
MNQPTHKYEYLQTNESDKINHLSLLLVNNEASGNSLDARTVLLLKSGISKRAINVCKLHDWTGRDNIKKGYLVIQDFKPLATLDDLSKWTKEELFELQNCGNKTILEFEKLLMNYGLELKSRDKF